MLMRYLQFFKGRRWLPLLVGLLLSLCSAGQPVVKGKVTGSADGLPVAGASVRVKGSPGGVITDSAGDFSIAAQATDVLVITHLSFEAQEVAVGSQSLVAIILTPSAGTLGAVVVTGYSSERKKDITGSVSVVDTRVLRSLPVASAAQALQGQASGVNVISSGVPGAQPNIFIRGVSSFGNTQPLVLVDGVQSSLANISADDIESMQVLKDAGAASVYGVRGSNGVIVVTTKKGKSGRVSVSYDGYYGIQQPLKGNAFDLVNPEEYGKLYLQVNPNSVLYANGLPDYVYASSSGQGIGNTGDPAVDPARYNLDIKNPSNNYIIQKINKAGTDWFSEVFQPAGMQNHNVSASGGSEKATYMFSLGYLNQQGTLIETFLKRYSARINTQFNVTRNIRFGENAYLFYREDRPFNGLQDASGGNVVSMIYRTFSYIPPYDIAGNYGGSYGGPELGSSRAPLGFQKQTADNKYQTWSMVGNIFAEADFFKHFTFRTSLGGTTNNQYQFVFTPTPYYNAEGNTAPNRLQESSQYGVNLMWTNTLSYAQRFGQHNLKVLGGTESIRNNGRSLTGSATTLFSDDPNYLTLSNGTQAITNGSSAYINTLFSLFGRLDYAFADKYLLSVTVRRDGSSVFGSDKRYGVFPSASVGWRVSGEKFMQGITWISDLKLRASYGVLGSQNNVSPANAYTLFASGPTTSYYDIAGTTNTSQQGFYQSTIGNPGTGWEENVVTNVGIDATLFNNKFDISVEWYKKSINGLLFSIPLPSTVGGASFPVVNIGDIQNQGVDITLGYRGSLGRDLGFYARGNLTFYKNRIVEIPGSGYFEEAASRNGNLIRNQEGQAVSSFFGYEVIGLFQDDADVARSPAQTAAAPGRFKYRDINGDGSITPDDRTFFGDPNPDFTYGINLGLTYKNFDLSTVLYGSQGNQVLNNTKWFTHFFGSFPSQKSKELLNAWTPTNTNTSVPKVEGASSFSTNGVPNSYYMEDGSFLRMRSLSLGYTFPAELISKIRLTRLRVYVQAANLFTITKYSGLDPELTGSSSNFGIDFGNYPNSRTWLFGLNLSF